MSLRTTERFLITSSLALMLAAGCGDGDSAPTVDAGIMDAGRPKDAGHDTGSDEPDEGPSISCGSKTCTGATVQQTLINPCCVPDSNVCGLNADDLRRANSSTPFTGCIPKDVAAAVEKSVYCGEFWDQVEMVKKANGGLDIASGSVTLTFDGCCLPTGECGAMIDTPRGQEADVVNTHLGCVSFSRLQDAFAAADASTMEQPAHLPYCNTSTGDPLMGMETVPGKPKFVCGCGVDKLYDPADASRTFPCFNSLPTTVCGSDNPKDEELAQVPEFICGCTTDSKLPCMINVDKSVCGTKQIDTNSAELALVPNFICGGSATTDSSGLPALKGVEPGVCGKKTPSTADLAMVPEFLCGCTAKNASIGFPCLRNADHAVCGGLQVTAASAPLLAQLPEFVCGCGADVVDPQTSLTCLSHVETSVCGAKLVDANSTDLNNVPEFICGAEGLSGTPALPVLKNVESTICGKKQIDANSAELALIPQFICGKDNNPDPSALPKLSGVDVSVCGTKTIAVGATELASIPAVVCGCGGAAPTNEFGCLRNVAANVCGTNLSQLPAVTCGCGATTALGATEKLCIPYTAATTCGTLAITLDSTNNCLNNLPEYAVGCGSSTPSATNQCVPGAPALHGCTSVASGTIRGVPTFLCGCGDGRLAGGLPCVDNVPTSVCGAQAIPLAALTTVEMAVCGCGTGVTYDPSNPAFAFPCISKTATTTCGPGAISTSDPNNTPGNVADDCYTRWPAYLNGCGSGVTTGSCIRNGSTTTFGCVQPSAGRSVPNTAYFACGCGRGQFPSTNPPNCIPNVNTDVCGAAAPTPTDTARAPTFFCGCGATVAARPSGAPSGRPCLSYTDTATCGTGSGGLDAAVLASLPSTLCGCGSTGTTWDPANTTTFPAPCLSKTTGVTCGGTEFCDENDAAGTPPCTGTAQCQDLRGGAGAGPFGSNPTTPDGLGDTCVP